MRMVVKHIPSGFVSLSPKRIILRSIIGKAVRTMKDVFTAKKINFQGEPGYMVCQYHNGEKVAERFVAEVVYAKYCKEAGIEAEILLPE